MATKYKLTWIVEKSKKGTRYRWRKKYKNKIHWFNVRKGETKGESYRRCLAEWEVKRAKLDDEAKANEPWFVTITKLIARTRTKMAELELEDTPQNRAAWQFARRQLESYEWYLANGVDVGDVGEGLLPGWPDQGDRDLRPPWEIETSTVIHGEESLRSNVDRFLEHKAAQAERGERSVGRYEKIRIGLEMLVDFVGVTKPIASIITATLTQFREMLQKRVDEGMIADSTARDVLQVVKQFTRWAYEQELIELPRVLQSRDFTISISEKPIETFTDDEVSTLLSGGSERTRIYLLLMLNCGMQQQDIADLRQDEVNWTTGYLTRKRSKTRKNGSVPEVSYKLWPETFNLLKQFRSKDKTLALTNANGDPLKVERIVDRKMKKIDNVRSAWNRLAKKTGVTKPPKLMRKTAASKLGGHPEYGKFAQHFLGHAPSTVADRHYVVPSQEQFDEAVTWLGSTFLGGAKDGDDR